MTPDEINQFFSGHAIKGAVELAHRMYADFYASATPDDARLLDQLVTTNTLMSLITAMPDQFKRRNSETADRLMHGGAHQFNAARTAFAQCASFRQLPAARRKAIEETYFFVMAMDFMPEEMRKAFWTQTLGPNHPAVLSGRN